MKDAISEALGIASRASDRLGDPSDSATAANVKRVFQLDMSSARDQSDLGNVKGKFGTLR